MFYVVFAAALFALVAFIHVRRKLKMQATIDAFTARAVAIGTRVKALNVGQPIDTSKLDAALTDIETDLTAKETPLVTTTTEGGQ